MSELCRTIYVYVGGAARLTRWAVLCDERMIESDCGKFNLADSLETASYGLVFGLNTFIALVLQSILTLVVTSSFGLALSIRPQFEVYSGCHFVVAAIFIAPPVYRCCRKCLATKKK
ncbi:hypothetical protein Y032_0211g2186 [Ancylostoma ceylanicum]|uniref:7TM GPCR serpentine receptor class x (Srx) domain-containing protein n=2 Tax=Ancylostoma ceylanicum TaxID=53326 RepID=A0A016SKZ2_9BILA|nr:hypothetical protein Y032_0211g2186 [Ancylostoma ceylanicum]